MGDKEEEIPKSVSGINKVRQPVLDFEEINDTDDYTEYTVKTFHIKQGDKEDKNPLTNYLDSFIFCNSEMNLKMPKKKYMEKRKDNKKIKDGKNKGQKRKRFAYAVGMFPNPKDGKPSYLDGCILAALGLKRQQTNADVICFVTPDMEGDFDDKGERLDKKKKKGEKVRNYIEELNEVFDEVIVVPYISPYDMGDDTIMMDKDIFKNCPNYTKKHPYAHVFFKLHIFNPDLFPYEKVCFVDSDLVPINYYDSLFMLECPAGFVEYRKKWPYLDAFNWDRCDYLEHGKPIPAHITDIDKKSGADVNAGLLLIKPDKDVYNEMIEELTQPLEKWMGPDKKHKGFHDMDFGNKLGRKFIANSYCYPEQNYLTKKFSGEWKYIEFAFQSWSRDPCTSFGIHMAAFNPKPWFKQPAGGSIKVNRKFIPYL